MFGFLRLATWRRSPVYTGLFGFRKWYLRGMRSRVVVHGIGMGSWKKMKIISLHQKGSARGLREPMKLVALLWQCLVFGPSDPENDVSWTSMQQSSSGHASRKQQPFQRKQCSAHTGARHPRDSRVDSASGKMTEDVRQTQSQANSSITIVE